VDSRTQESLARALLATRAPDVSWLRDRVHHLWSGDLLPGWYDDWVLHERERLRQLRLHALERAARIFLQERELDLAVALALEAVSAEPLRESANAVLISVYLAEGNVVDALRRYEQFRGQLHLELGLDPSPTMATLLPTPTPTPTSHSFSGTTLS
jgi:DNA-binding SARP family transcriptional activator